MTTTIECIFCCQNAFPLIAYPIDLLFHFTHSQKAFVVVVIRRNMQVPSLVNVHRKQHNDNRIRDKTFPYGSYARIRTHTHTLLHYSRRRLKK